MVTAAGGEGIAAAVDHADDEQTKALFTQIGSDQGRIEILVNIAATIRDEMMGPTSFGKSPSTSSTLLTLDCEAVTSRRFSLRP